MTTEKLARSLEDLRSALLRRDGANLTDGQLLGLFLSHRDEAAFEALLRRHGPMVFSVCRRIIGNLHDAEDAFQATFLVLARKAASVVPREAVGNWLYGVAYRTALKARTMALRRRMREKQVEELPQLPAPEAENLQDLERLLDQELNRLPDKYRLLVVLCDLEGRTRRDVARQLGLPDGTVSNRLAAGRRMLARRLARRGLSAAGAAAVTVLAQTVARASLPPPLVHSTVQAAALVAAGTTPVAVVSPQVFRLMKGELQTMLLTKLKIAAVVLVVAAVGGLARSGTQDVPPTPARGVAAQALGSAANKSFPVWVNAKAFVQREGETALRIRAELPSGRFLKLLDADGRQVQIHEFVNWQPPPSPRISKMRACSTPGAARRI